MCKTGRCATSGSNRPAKEPPSGKSESQGKRIVWERCQVKVPPVRSKQHQPRLALILKKHSICCSVVKQSKRCQRDSSFKKSPFEPFIRHSTVLLCLPYFHVFALQLRQELLLSRQAASLARLPVSNNDGTGGTVHPLRCSATNGLLTSPLPDVIICHPPLQVSDFRRVVGQTCWVRICTVSCFPHCKSGARVPAEWKCRIIPKSMVAKW
jgi:hypothetical protein